MIRDGYVKLLMLSHFKAAAESTFLIIVDVKFQQMSYLLYAGVTSFGLSNPGKLGCSTERGDVAASVGAFSTFIESVLNEFQGLIWLPTTFICSLLDT